MAKKAKAKAPKVAKAVAVEDFNGNWLAQMDFEYIRGANGERVNDRRSYVVNANGEEAAREAAEGELEAELGIEPEIDITVRPPLKKTQIQVRPLTPKEQDKWEASKAVPVF